MTENQTTPTKQNKNNFLNKQYILIFSLVGVIAIGIISFAVYSKFNKPVTENKISQNSQSTIYSSPDNKVKLQTLSESSKNDAQASLASFNSNPFDPETEKPTDRFITFKIRQGQKYRMTINYSNIGDEGMKKGSVKIKLGPNLSLVKNSMKEEISGKQEISIDDTNLYSPDTNTIQYGPGSSNQIYSQVLAGDTGKITFDVEMSSSASVNDISRIYSYLSDEGDSKGKIDLVFFEFTPKL